MSPSTYQTVPFADPSKVEPSSTPVSLWKKVGVAAMVGAALVAGNSYGSNNNTNSSMTDIDAFLSVKEDISTEGIFDPLLLGPGESNCIPHPSNDGTLFCGFRTQVGVGDISAKGIFF